MELRAEVALPSKVRGPVAGDMGSFLLLEMGKALYLRGESSAPFRFQGSIAGVGCEQCSGSVRRDADENGRD